MTRRVLPHSLEAEASLLGAILLRNEVLPLVANLPPEAFYHLGHQTVYAAMLHLAGAHQPIDVTTLEARLLHQGRLDAIGGISFVGQLAQRVPTADNVAFYADIVADRFAARSLILALSASIELGYGDYGDAAAYQANVMTAVRDAMQRTSRSGPRAAAQVVKELARDIQRRLDAEDGITGVPTGYAELDADQGGLQPTDLTILAARPSMGKTALAVTIAKQAAQAGYPVAVFSLEMSALQLMKRLLCAEARVSTTALRKGRITRPQMAAVHEGMPRLAQLPLFIDETPALTIHEVQARSHRFAEEHSNAALGLVVVDYLQLMKGNDRYRNREQEIAEISGGLKSLAKNLKWPVLALSQLNRSLEARSNKRPQMSDLRESGAIEQDADNIFFLYRDVVYNEDTPEPDLAELIIAKHRNGKPGMIRLRFDDEFTRFVSMR